MDIEMGTVTSAADDHKIGRITAIVPAIAGGIPIEEIDRMPCGPFILPQNGDRVMVLRDDDGSLFWVGPIEKSFADLIDKNYGKRAVFFSPEQKISITVDDITEQVLLGKQDADQSLVSGDKLNAALIELADIVKGLIIATAWGPASVLGSSQAQINTWKNKWTSGSPSDLLTDVAKVKHRK